MTDFLPFARPCLTEKTILEVTKCLKSNWLATGPRVQEFEQKLAAYFGAKHALVVTSATGGLFLSLKALDLKEGDEVITTPLTFVATLNTIIHAGAKPVLVDIDPFTRNINIDSIERTITKNTKAIMPVHFAGLPVDMDPLLEIAKKYNLTVIEDAAHAMGAFYKDKKIGSFGDIQVFSFHPCKNMTTAEGGCLVTNDDALASRIKSLRFFGIDRDAWNRHAKGGSSAYDIKEPGYKYNMSDLQATIGLTQLEELDCMNQKRRDLVKFYREHLKDIKGISLPGAEDQDNQNSWHIFTILVDKETFGMDRNELEIALKEKDIGSGHHYPAVHLYTYFKETYGWQEGDFPVSENVGKNIISLPLFPDMAYSDCQRVVDALKDIQNERT
ncbi:MAG: UDP-4-amino-4-deoxy-L-arabinose--oxoglutarate aminotransferase [Holosporales bacterium]